MLRPSFASVRDSRRWAKTGRTTVRHFALRQPPDTGGNFAPAKSLPTGIGHKHQRLSGKDFVADLRWRNRAGLLFTAGTHRSPPSQSPNTIVSWLRGMGTALWHHQPRPLPAHLQSRGVSCLRSHLHPTGWPLPGLTYFFIISITLEHGQ